MKTNGTILLAAQRYARQALVPRIPRGAFLWPDPDGIPLIVAYGHVRPANVESALLEVGIVKRAAEDFLLPVVECGLFPEPAGGQTWVLIIRNPDVRPAAARDREQSGGRAEGAPGGFAVEPDSLDHTFLSILTKAAWEARDQSREVEWTRRGMPGGCPPEPDRSAPPPPRKSALEESLEELKRAQERAREFRRNNPPPWPHVEG